MSLAKKSNLSVVKATHKGLSYVKGGADSFNELIGSNASKEKRVTQNDFSKMLVVVQEEERKRIGRELHDSVNPLLALANLYLELVPATTAKEKFAKKQIFTVILSAIENIRTISSHLVVSQKTESSLIQLMTEMIEQINGTGIFKITLTHSKQSMISELCPYIKLVLFRIMEEQLNNTIKHSKAKHVEIKLLRKKNNIYLSIADDGVGFDTEKKASGIGIKNIEARTKQFDGRMSLQSAPGKGCHLNIVIPFSKQ